MLTDMTDKNLGYTVKSSKEVYDLTTVEDGATLAGVGAESTAIVLLIGGHLLAAGIEGHGGGIVALALALPGLGLLLGLGPHHPEVTVGASESICLHCGFRKGGK